MSHLNVSNVVRLFLGDIKVGKEYTVVMNVERSTRIERRILISL